MTEIEKMFVAAQGEADQAQAADDDHEVTDEDMALASASAMARARTMMNTKQALASADVALDFGVSKDDPLWNIIHALGYYQTVAEQIPEQIAQAGEYVSESLEKDLSAYKASVEAAASKFTSLAERLPDETRKAARAAAVQALEVAINGLDHNTTIEAVSERVGERLAEQHKLRWARLGMGITATFGVTCLIAGLALGWLLKGATVTEVTPGQERLLEQIQCSKTQQGRTVCRFINGGVF